MVLYNRTEGERATEGDEPARSQAPQVHKIFYEGAIIMLMPTILADFLIDNPIIIHLAYLSHLSKDFLLLYVAEFVKSVVEEAILSLLYLQRTLYLQWEE